MKKVLIPQSLASLLDHKIEQQGLKSVHLPNQQPATIARQAADVSGAILMNEPFPGKLMAKLPNLKIAARFGVGYDNLD